MFIASAGWRIWHLLAIDTILDPVRERLFPVIQDELGDPVVAGKRLLDWIECPYCAGFWVTAAVWLAWVITPWTLVAVAPFAIHTGMIAIEKLLSPGE